MIRAGNIQVGDHVKKWSYSRIIERFGDRGKVIAEACGVKKTSKKKESQD